MDNVTDSIVIVHVFRDERSWSVTRTTACHSLSGSHTGTPLRCSRCGVWFCADCAERREVEEPWQNSLSCPVCGEGAVQKRDEHLFKKDQ